MRVFQIGAAGGVGARLAGILHARGDESSGMHRNPAQADAVRATGATPVPGDLIADSVGELAEKMRGHDAVVFSAGAHGTGMDQTTLIDGKGLEKSADAAVLAGISRFILISAFPESERDAGLGAGYEHYMRVKKQADVYLARTNLDWLIVRPGMLSNDPGDGFVAAGPAIEYGVVRRDNVAAFLGAALQEPQLNRAIVELTDGDLPVRDAVAGLLRQGRKHL